MNDRRPQVVLLDLGNVIVDIDFRRVFRAWAESAAVDEQRFYERWEIDDPYKRHEVGALDFKGYTDHLADVFDVELSGEAWLEGWNALFLDAFPEVVRALAGVEVPTFCFSNTNAAHQAYWSRRYAPVLDQLDHVFTSNEIGMRKPDADAFDFVASAMGAAPERILFVDDSLENVEGARSAGLQAVHARSAGDVVQALKDLTR